MDSPYFHPETALTDILSTSNVSQLVNKCNELQIGNANISAFHLDNRHQKLWSRYPSHGFRKLQQIHYLHWHSQKSTLFCIKLTLKMKEDIEKVDSKLKSLEDSIKMINSSALRIDDNLKIKRNEIQKLDTINKDLQRVII